MSFVADFNIKWLNIGYNEYVKYSDTKPKKWAICSDRLI